jgi:hypothetical protein
VSTTEKIKRNAAGTPTTTGAVKSRGMGIPGDHVKRVETYQAL